MITKMIVLVSGFALLSSSGFAETNVTTKTVTKTYVGDSMQAETNETHTVEGHMSLRRKMRMQMQGVDATLALRERRAGYKGGEWSKDWKAEAAAWLESQDLEKLTPAFEFVDSKGFRHLMSFAIVDDRGHRIRAEMKLKRAKMEAQTALSRALDADVERCLAESKLKTESYTEALKSESSMSVGSHAGITQLLAKPLKVGYEKKMVIVYGIMPSCMKFEYTSEEIEEIIIKARMKRQEESIKMRKFLFPNEKPDWDPNIGTVDIDDMYCPWKYDNKIK